MARGVCGRRLAPSEAAASRSYLVTGLTNGTSYQLRVTAKSSLGPGVTGDPVGAVPAGLPSKPSVTLSASAGRMIIKGTRPSTNGAALTGYGPDLAERHVLAHGGFA